MWRSGAPGPRRVCALGALEEMGLERDWFFSPHLEPQFLRHIVRLNDELGWTFPEIAGWLEQLADGTLTTEEALAVTSPDERVTMLAC